MLESLRHTVITEKLSEVIEVAGLIACMTAGIAVLKVIRTYMVGNTMDPWDFLKPLVLMFIVCNFDTMVMGPVNGFCGIISREAAEVFDMNPNRYVDQWAYNMAKIGAHVREQNSQNYEAELKAIAEDTSVIGAFFSKIWLAIKKFLLDFFNIGTLTIGGIVGGILFIAAKVLLFAQQLLCGIFLMINSLLGPFILALSILPGYTSGFKNWFARQMQISMWIPVGYMCMSINLLVSDFFVNKAVNGDATLSLEWMMIVLQIVSLVSITMVPKFVTWFIHIAGSSDAHKTFSNMAKKAMKM